jgi:hypothetical protein
MQLFDMGNLNILVGPKGLKVGDELTVRLSLVLYLDTIADETYSSSTLPPNGTWPSLLTVSAGPLLAVVAFRALKT